MSGSMRGRRLEEITQSNISFPWGSEIPFGPRGVMAIEVSQNEEISGKGKDGKRKGVGSAILEEEQVGGSINIRNESEEEFFKEMLILT